VNDTDRDPTVAGAGFPQRLATMIGNASVRAFARQTGVSDTFLRQCLAARTDPTRAKLIAIARTGETSLEWLATGRRDIASGTPSAALDSEHLQSVIETVEAVIAEDRLRDLPPFEKAQLIHAVYAYHDTAPPLETVRATLRKLSATAD
jgi:DNA-binding transcriptional regulator YdaS (Cro superfamily)